MTVCSPTVVTKTLARVAPSGGAVDRGGPDNGVVTLPTAVKDADARPDDDLVTERSPTVVNVLRAEPGPNPNGSGKANECMTTTGAPCVSAWVDSLRCDEPVVVRYWCYYEMPANPGHSMFVTRYKRKHLQVSEANIDEVLMLLSRIDVLCAQKVITPEFPN